MAEKGYLIKEQDKNDKRKQNLYLTEKGQRAMADVRNAIVKKLSDMYPNLSSDEQDTLIEKMNYLMENLYR